MIGLKYINFRIRNGLEYFLYGNINKILFYIQMNSVDQIFHSYRVIITKANVHKPSNHIVNDMCITLAHFGSRSEPEVKCARGRQPKMVSASFPPSQPASTSRSHLSITILNSHNRTLQNGLCCTPSSCYRLAC